MMLDDQTRLMTLKCILQETELVPGDDGAVYARFAREGRQVTYPTTSPDFMIWFQGAAAPQFTSLPSAKIMKQAVKEIEYEVRQKGRSYPVATRIFAGENAVVLHLGDGKALKIEASGAGQVLDPEVIFSTATNIRALLEPESADVLKVLPEFLDLSEAEFQLALIWLMSLFQADGRYPVLIISGPPQSGKTRLASNIRRLLDPHRLSLLPLPKDREGLKDAVLENAVLAFDNVEKIPRGMEEDLLALAEGTAISLPDRSRPVQCKRPTILVCEDLPEAPGLVENAIVLRLKERPPTNLKTRPMLDRRFHQHHAAALGSLVELCSRALRHRNEVAVQAVHKDADLERWILAIDKGLALNGKLMGAFTSNLAQAHMSIVNERPALRSFQALVRTKGSVKATATQILDQIEPFLDGPKDARYPTSGKALAKLLRDHRRFMPDIEIEFDIRTGKDRDRNIVATWWAPKPGKGCAAVAPPLKRPVQVKKANYAVQDQPTLL